MTYEQALEVMVAEQLARLGARSGVLERLTSLSRQAVRSLIKSATGRSPVSGQMVYTTLWYERRRERMLHGSLLASIHDQFKCYRFEPRAARFLWEYQFYRNVCRLGRFSDEDQVFDVNHAFHMLEFYRQGEFTRRHCGSCAAPFVDSVAGLQRECPACVWHQQLFCRSCHTPLPIADRARPGKKRRYCEGCCRLTGRKARPAHSRALTRLEG